MAGEIRAHSFTQQVLMVQGRTIENFGEGDDVINTEWREDGITDVIGADGKMQMSISANESAEITVKLLANAPENDYFYNLYKQVRQGSIKGISVAMYNSVTGAGEVATTGYIKKLPNNAKGTNAQDKEWVFVVPKVAIQLAIR